jgi:hypothetical protein
MERARRVSDGYMGLSMTEQEVTYRVNIKKVDQ